MQELRAMLSERQSTYLRSIGSKLISPEHLGRLAKNPRLAYDHARQFFFNVDLRAPTHSQTILDSALGTLATLGISSPQSLEQWLPIVDSPATNELGDLFKARGSDKSTDHDYYEVYGSILDGKRDKPLNILEIGLGTNNIDIISNMSAWGKPGASLRAFRDWAPKALIYGADVDRRILFEEDRISTSWVDQTDPISLARLAERQSGKRFDLIIDDGLHLPHANMNTLRALLPLLADDGTFVVEDIILNFDLWKVASTVLAPKYESYFVERKGGALFIIRHRRPTAT